MAGFTFEGEIESLSPRQQEFVSEVIQKRGLKAKRVLIETLGEAGDNYAANVKKINVYLENGEVFKMVAKIAPTNEILRITMSTSLTFGNECTFYNEAMPKFVNLQHAAGLSSEEIFRYPECYGALLEPLNEIILLENLKELNYKMYDRFTPLSNECIKLILKNFAILHALSFVLKQQEPETFESYNDKFGNIYSGMLEHPNFKVLLRQIENDTISLLDSDKHKKAIRGTVSKLLKGFAKIVQHDRNSRYSVLIHGDAWTNNVMFQIEENVPLQAILIDYQLSRVVSPVNDLHYMIFNCTDYNLRHKHYYEWIDYYHSEMDNYLSNFGLKANYVYPRDQLDADLRRYSNVYLALGLMAQSMTIRNSEDAADFKEAMQKFESDDFLEEVEALQVSHLDPKSVSLYKKKIEDLIESYIEFGYVDS